MECEGEGGKAYAPIARKALWQQENLARMRRGISAWLSERFCDIPKSPIRFLVMHAPSAVWQLIAGNYAEFSGGCCPNHQSDPNQHGSTRHSRKFQPENHSKVRIYHGRDVMGFYQSTYLPFRWRSTRADCHVRLGYACRS